MFDNPHKINLIKLRVNTVCSVAYAQVYPGRLPYHKCAQMISKNYLLHLLIIYNFNYTCYGMLKLLPNYYVTNINLKAIVLNNICTINNEF